MKRLLIPLLTAAVLAVITIVIIAYGSGKRFNTREREVSATGLLNATSDPDSAQVLIDGELRTATDSPLNLLPGIYKIKITKEGYLPWEKEFTISAGVVAEANAFLFPANPALSPLTITGVKNPTVSPDGTSIAFLRLDTEATKSASIESDAFNKAAKSGQKQSGIFVLDLEDKPLSFSRKPRQILSFAHLEALPSQQEGRISGLNPQLLWSPDTKNILLTFSSKEKPTKVELAYLLDANRLNTQPLPVNSLSETLKLWEEQRELEARSKIKSLPNALIPFFTNVDGDEIMPGVKTSGVTLSGSPDVGSLESPGVKKVAEIISFSPDESKILFRAKEKATIPQIIKPPLLGTNPTPEVRTIEPDNMYVYDVKEDRNYLLPQTVDSRQQTADQDSNSKSLNLKWFPTSRHLFYVDDGSSADSTDSPQADSGQAKIKVMEYDATNKISIYAGPFEPDFVVPWPNGSKFVILTSLNPDASETLNLYAVKLR